MASIFTTAGQFINSLLSGSERATARDFLAMLGIRPSASNVSTVSEILDAAGMQGEKLGVTDLDQLLDAAGFNPVNIRPSRRGVETMAEIGGIRRGRTSGRRRSAGGGGRRGGGGRGIGEIPPEEPIGPWEPPAEPAPADDKLAPWIENAITAPESTNVYSFAYDPNTSTLYVTYKGVKLNEGVKTTRGRIGRGQGKHQFKGERGATLAGRTNMPGATYAYLDVPARVFTRMKHASSKGKFVWDELRVRGTIYGHKYRYQLVQGALVTQGSFHGIYVPRRATRKGFRVRTEAGMGRGRRGFAMSALPSQTGFSTRRK